MTHMEHIVKRLRETGGLDAALMRAAADTIETLTAERDEVRRIAIALQVQLQQVSPGPKHENPSDTARRIAEERGWNINEEAMP